MTHGLVVAHRLRNKAFPRRGLSFIDCLRLWRVELGSGVCYSPADFPGHLNHLLSYVILTDSAAMPTHPALKQHDLRRAVVAMVKFATLGLVLEICRTGDCLEVKHGTVVV